MMELNFAMLKEIDQKTKDTIFGYIRNYKNIPKEICNVCLLFYGYGPDEWDIDQMPTNELKLKQNRVIKLNNDRVGNAYFKRIAKNGYHEWKFVVAKHNVKDSDTMIGVWRINKDKDPPTTIFFNSNDNGYAFHLDGFKHDGYRKFRYGPKCNSEIFNTKVKMIMDFDKGSMKFVINDKDCGEAFKIEAGEYKAAVYIDKPGDSIQFIP